MKTYFLKQHGFIEHVGHHMRAYKMCKWNLYDLKMRRWREGEKGHGGERERAFAVEDKGEGGAGEEKVEKEK